MISAALQTSPDHLLFPTVAQPATPQIVDRFFLVRFLPPAVSQLRTLFWQARCTSLSLRPVVNVAIKVHSVKTQNSIRVGCCIEKERHVSLVPTSELAVQLEPKLMPVLLIILKRNGPRCEFQHLRNSSRHATCGSDKQMPRCHAQFFTISFKFAERGTTTVA